MTERVPSASHEERWTRRDTWTFTAFGLGMLLENYIFSLTPIADGWVRIPSWFSPWMSSWGPLWLIVGIAVGGPLADRLGRKKLFYANLALYALGGLGLIFLSLNAVWLAVFLAAMLFAAGGEMNAVMVATHELMPSKHRSKAMMLELNFINFGGLILALLAFSSGAWNNSIALQKVSVGVALLIVLVLLTVFRARTPESLRWLVAHGDLSQAEAQAVQFYGPEEGPERYRRALLSRTAPPRAADTPLAVRLYAIIAMAFAGSAGFGLMTYVIGPYYFSGLTTDVILISAVVGFLTGAIGLWGDRLSRRGLLLASYLATLALTAAVYLTVASWSKNVVLFWAFLVAMNVVINVAYLTEDTLKGELWPTPRRGLYTALVRFVAIGLYIGTIYFTAHFNVRHTMLFSLIVWAIGASGAVLWFLKGVETGEGRALEAASSAP
ncbi:MAG: MFS transporter [Firmicutes bacterium]|nr:MFS transporter [Bacillota bacterium]